MDWQAGEDLKSTKLIHLHSLIKPIAYFENCSKTECAFFWLLKKLENFDLNEIVMRLAD